MSREATKDGTFSYQKNGRWPLEGGHDQLLDGGFGVDDLLRSDRCAGKEPRKGRGGDVRIMGP